VDPRAKAPGGFLDLFGRPPRESACECERSGGMQLGPVLAMINGPVVNESVKDPANRLSQLVAREKDDAKVVEELYLSILARFPTRRELEVGAEAIRSARDIHMEMLAEQAKAKADLEAHEKDLDARQPAWEAGLMRQASWTVLQPEEVKSAGGAVLTKQPDGSVLASGKNPFPETYTVTAKTGVAGITAFRLEVLSDKKLPSKGPGRAQNGNFVLSEFKVEVQQPGEPMAKAMPLGRAIADFSQESYDVARAIDNNPATGWAVVPQTGRNHVAIFELKGGLSAAPGSKLIITMLQNYEGKDHNIGKFRLSVTTTPGPLSLESLPAEVVKALHTELPKRTPQQLQLLRNMHRTQDGRLSELQRAVADHATPADPRLVGAQDLAWALLNSREFLFNH
jgi:hypothetical protein